MPELQRQMHQEDGNVVEFQLDDEPLDPRVEIMEPLAAHTGCREERIRLFANDGYQVVDRGNSVLAFESRVMTQGAGDEVGLVHHSRSDGPGVDLDQANDVRIL